MDESEWVFRNANSLAKKCIETFAVRRLRVLQLDATTLRAMKKELRSFDMVSGEWK
jgi:hypothetical protein